MNMARTSRALRGMPLPPAPTGPVLPGSLGMMQQLGADVPAG